MCKSIRTINRALSLTLALLLCLSLTLLALASDGDSGEVSEVQINVSVSPSGSGIVSGGGIYNSGDTVNLTAAPNTGWAFSGWYENGVQVHQDKAFGFTASESRSFEARFVVIQQFLITTSVSPTGRGTATGGGTFNSGNLVTLVATPSTGWGFDGWYEGSVKVSADATWSFNATENRTLQARFLQQFTVTTSISPLGSGTVSGGSTVNSGATVTLHAMPNTGWKFDGWYEGSTKMSSDASWSFIVTANRSLQARFIQDPQVALRALLGVWSGEFTNSSGPGLVTLDVYEESGQFWAIRTNHNKPGMSNQHPFSIKNTVTFDPATGLYLLKFSEWIIRYSDDSDPLRFSGKLEGNVFSGTTLVHSTGAYFGTFHTTRTGDSTTQSRTITTTTSPSGSGTATGGGSFKIGETVTLTAKATAGWQFGGWYEADNRMSTNATLSFIVDSDRTLEARFVQSTVTIPGPYTAWPGAEEELLLAIELGLVPESLMIPGIDLRRPITRVEFAGVAVLTYEVLSNTVVLPAIVNPFADTNSMDALKAFNAGIMVGVSDTNFSPHTKLTREQAATALTRVFKRSTMPGWTFETDRYYPLQFARPAPFADDANISSWAREGVYFMAAHDIIRGVGNNVFAPRAVTDAQRAAEYALATRQQAIAIALRMVINLGGE